MLVFLIHVRDPQFYALPAKTRAKNGNIRVMGFPPIGVMSLSAVVKRAGHECVMFDQANPETPNEVIIEEIRRQQPALVGLSFLSTTSYPYAKILARQIRAVDTKVKLAFGGVFASLNAPLVKHQCPEVDFVCRGDGEQLMLDLLERLNDPADIESLTWVRNGQVVNNPNRKVERQLDQWPFPDRESLKLDFVESSMKASGDPAARSTSWTSSSTSRRSATARSILSMIISCCSRSGSRPSAKASTTTASRFSGAAKDGSIRLPSTCFQRWRKRTVVR